MAKDLKQPFKKGEINPYNKFFTGNTYLTRLVEKEIQILKPGDAVKIPPNVEHWHGAASNSEFAHISIETNIPENTTEWLLPVTDEEYK